MKNKLLKLGSLLAAVVIMLSSASVAQAASNVTSKEITPGTTTFTYTLDFDAIASPYASAQFDIIIHNNQNSGLDIASNGILYANNIIGGGKATPVTSAATASGYQMTYQTGFLSTSNQFGSASSVCTITFSYTGSSTATVTFDNLKVWRLEDAGGGSAKIVESAISDWSRTLTVARGTTMTPGGGGTGDTGGTGGTGNGTSGSTSGGTNNDDDNEASAAGTETEIVFSDVAPGAWYYDAVLFVVSRGLFDGSGGGKFSPDVSMTRSMLVTVLYRLEGKPTVAGTNRYPDVENGQWYTDAVLWATQNGIVTGYDNGNFGTNDKITREQIATILYRYTKYKGYAVSTSAALSRYSDAGKVSDWAGTAMSWANAEGIITGRTETTLVPDGAASRAEVATMLMRFVERYAG